MQIFIESVREKFEGDDEGAFAHIEELRRTGALQQIQQAAKFDLREMVKDRKQFINQLNSQFGGADVNDLISLQIDEFKVNN